MPHELLNQSTEKERILIINKIVRETLDIIKGSKSIITKRRDVDEEKNLPMFNPIYIPSVVDANRIEVHSDGVFPKKLFHEKAPNQDEAEFLYAKGIYKERTMALWENLVSRISRIWNRNNFKIEKLTAPPANESTAPAKEYFLEDYPRYKSILSYFELVVTNWKLKDPNALICIRPKQIPMIGDRVDQSALIEPIAIIHGSQEVIQYFEEEWSMVLLNEKSWVMEGNLRVKKGFIYEIYDKENIWRIFQTGKLNDEPKTFNIELFYKHDLGYLPCVKLKGRPRQKGAFILYQSYIFPAIPSLDNIAINYSNLDMSIYHGVYPHKWEYVDKCKVANCVNGWIGIGSDREICTGCGGTGNTSRTGPTGVTQIEAPSTLNDAAKDIKIPPLGWEAPDPTILEFLLKVIMNDIKGAFAMLNIDISDSNAKGSETALGKMIDREEFFSFLTNIATELFDTLRFTIDTIGLMRYGDKFEAPEISTPVNFSIRTAEELTEELKVAREAKIPAPAFKKLLQEFLSKRFNQDKNIEKFTDLVFLVDPLVMMTEQEISMGLSNGTLDKMDSILHTFIIQFIQQAQTEDPEFFEKDLEEQMRIIGEKAVNKLGGAQVQATMTDGIIAQANGTPVAGAEIEVSQTTTVEGITAEDLTLEKEAQAKLKGTVGGIQGVLSIQEAIIKGTLTRESGIVFLESFFGFTADEASKLLGKVPKLKLTDVEKV